MFAFILRRLLQAVAVMLTVALLAFVLFQYVGDPVTIMLGQDATDAERIELRERARHRSIRPLRGQRRAGQFRYLPAPERTRFNAAEIPPARHP
ncbi:hypothetical protein D3C75_1087680 [compost metagenome]